MMEPADAGPISLHQVGACEDEAPGADTDQWNADLVSVLDVSDELGRNVAATAQQPTDDHQIIKSLGIAERFRRAYRHTAARRDRIIRRSQYTPRASNLPATVALVGSESQGIHETGKGK